MLCCSARLYILLFKSAVFCYAVARLVPSSATLSCFLAVTAARLGHVCVSQRASERAQHRGDTRTHDRNIRGGASKRRRGTDRSNGQQQIVVGGGLGYVVVVREGKCCCWDERPNFLFISRDVFQTTRHTHTTYKHGRASSSPPKSFVDYCLSYTPSSLSLHSTVFPWSLSFTSFRCTNSSNVLSNKCIYIGETISRMKNRRWIALILIIYKIITYFNNAYRSTYRCRLYSIYK